jgi:metal-responsive CopG/Arc/MetJ family transcriptional regulator
MAHKSIKLPKSLWQRIEKCSQAAGYSSPEEFIEHVLERELAKLEDAAPSDEIAKRLRGLGYLD